MKASELAKFKAALEQMRADILAAGAIKIEPNRTDAVSVGVADEDAQALSEMNQSLASARNRTNAKVLKLIATALHKIAEDPDSYGLCDACDEAITQKRLQLMPYAERCAECQADEDPQRKITRKSLTDYKV